MKKNVRRQQQCSPAARWWLDNKDQMLAAVFAIALVGWLTVFTMITMGEYPSGPVAGLSAHPRDHIGSPSSCSTGHDPYTIASRADHGHLVGGAQ